MTKEVEAELTGLLNAGHVALYEYRQGALPNLLVQERGKGGVTQFFRQDEHPPQPGHGVNAAPYESLADVGEWSGDICLLDGRAIRVLLIKYPRQCRYVLVSMVPSWSWLVALPGLLRRFYQGTVVPRGLLPMEAGGRSRRWLILQNAKAAAAGSLNLSVSVEVGVSGLLDHLRRTRVQYVVLRFFEQLPALSGAGDLDILVADEDTDKIRDFLLLHPGSIRVDLHRVSGLGNNGIPYYPPALAKQILTRAVDGPAGSRVPAPREAFLSLAYHALYHKGGRAGIPTRLPVPTEASPGHDYADLLARMADGLGVQVTIDMESLDDYLQREGWRPRLDTLAIMMSHNEWLRRRLFVELEAPEIGLGVFILKEKALREGIVGDVTAAIENQGFRVLRQASFDDLAKQGITDTLRGGNWIVESGEPADFLPSMAVAVLDIDGQQALRSSRATFERRMRGLKVHLRRRFDNGTESMIHATDTTSQAWEYIEACFPNEVVEIREEIDRCSQSTEPSVLGRARLRTRYLLSSLRYWCSASIQRCAAQLGSTLTRWVVR